MHHCEGCKLLAEFLWGFGSFKLMKVHFKSVILLSALLLPFIL